MTSQRRFKLHALGVATTLAVAFVLFGYFLTLSGTHLPVAHDAGFRIHAIVPSAVALAPHADVRNAGVRIGEVERIATRGHNAVLTLSLERSYSPVYRDARVLIRGKALTGENYVDLDPGSPRAGAEPAGATLQIANAPESTQLDQIFSALDAPHRRDLQRILDALGQGLGGHGSDLNRFVDGGSAVIRESQPVNAVLAPKREELAGLVDDFGQVMRALGERATALRVLARRSREIATAVAARDRQLRATLAALPGFLRQAGGTSARLGRFSTTATPVMRNLRIATDELAPAMQQLRPAADETRATMRALGAFAAKATPMLANLRGFASATTRFAPSFEAFLRQANPLVSYLAPYAREMAAVFSNMRATTEGYDALGHFARIQGLVTKSSFVGVFTADEEQAYRALLKAGAVEELSDTRGINAYPRPGGVVAPQAFGGKYPRVEADPPYRR